MSILITGGGGQLGSEFAELLAASGASFSALNRAQLDVTDEAALQTALQDGREPVHAVIHTAAYTKVDAAETERELAYAINATATRLLARLCAERQIPLVYISTDFIFSGSSKAPYEVDDAPDPLNVYGASKLAGEQAIQEVCDRFYIVRTSWVFGSHGHNFPRAMLKAAANGQPLRVVNDQVGSPTYARDLAEAILR
nr:dTDP-4-dehydrorhamnose reductase [Armatimonadota bacterium]